ncbi:MAG: 3D domain-containing protein [Clostridia bacterium]|nr:3D domain-containing protein [Clostridia bacterium]
MIDNTKSIKNTIGWEKFILGFLIIMVLVLGLITYYPKEITVIVDDTVTYSTTKLKTSAKTIEELVTVRQLVKSPEDRVTYDCLGNKGDNLDETIRHQMVIKVDRAFEVPVTADKKTVILNTPTVTALEALEKAGVEVKDEDIVLPSRNHMLRQGDKVVLKRVVIKYKRVKTALEYKTKTIHDSSLGIGQRKVLKQGKYGKGTKVYKLMYVDGKLYKTVLDKKIVKKKPVTKVIAYGTNISFKPYKGAYKKKISVKAVSYHFSGNPHGSYGLPCTYGTMAVDRRVIPLGTKCYVEGYGYAIANDTGSSIKGNKIDLYMEANFQALTWGARRTTVYILK